ncbi:MAG: TIR domain-containing protein [Halieaceae bacterium]
MRRVFVSYAQEDRELISRYTAELKAVGWDVWWDDAIKSGDDWTESIERELDRCDCIVIFWSTHSVKSPWVRIEAHHAKRRGCIVPVRLDDAEIPDEYRLLQTIDARSTEPGSSVAELSAAVHTAIAGQSRRRWRRGLGIALATGAAIALLTLISTPLTEDAAPTSTISIEESWQAIRGASTLEELAVIEQQFAAALDADPESVRAHAGMCATYLRRYALSRRDADLALAQASCDSATALDEDAASSAEANGWLAYYTGSGGEAVSRFRQAISLDANNSAAHLGLAAALESQGDYEGAERSFSEATVVEPGSWRAQNAMALFLQRHGRTEDAIDRFELALKIAPDNVSMLNNLGVSKLFNVEYADAVAAWNRVLEITPIEEHGATLTNIGSAYYLLRDFVAAKIAFEKATRLMGDDYRAWDNLADSLVALEQREQARTARRRALDRAGLIYGQNKTDYLSLASIASSRSALGEAGWEVDIELALSESPEDPEIRRVAALCYLRAGNPDSAAAQYAEALKLGYPEFLLAADYQFDAISNKKTN